MAPFLLTGLGKRMSGYGLAIDRIVRRKCDDAVLPDHSGGCRNAGQPRRPALSTFASVWTDFHMHQCLVAAFALACARKKRIISRLASGPRASV